MSFKKATPRRRRRAAKWGLTLSGSTAWPVYDLDHAHLALQYMANGFGGSKWRPKYPEMVRRLAWLYPPHQYPALWKQYSKLKGAISRQARARVPTLKQLRHIGKLAA